MIVIKKSSITETIVTDLNDLTLKNLETITKDIYGLCRTTNDLVQQKVDSDLNVARHTVASFGNVSQSEESVNWEAINQFTKSNQQVSLPKLIAGNTWLGQNRDLAVHSPIVDDIKKLVGGTCTVFQRMNENGDMLRVATNVKKLDNSRAIGTFIPATNPDGSANNVISTVMSGRTFRGRAFVVNAWYVTAYEPIRDADDKIIGMLYVGVKQESVESLRESIINTQVGKDGYVFVLGGKGSQKGHYIISKEGQRDGENVWDAKDSDGSFMVQEMVTKALPLQDDNVVFNYYHWKDDKKSQPRKKVAALAYFEPWDWIIGVSSYDDDFFKTVHSVKADLANMNMWILVFGLLLLAFSAIAAYVFGNKITKPLRSAIQAIMRVAETNIPNHAKNLQLTAKGDFSGQESPQQESIEITSNDEIGQMAKAVNTMLGNLYNAENDLTLMKNNIKEVVDDVDGIVQAAVAGKMDVRASIDTNKGEFSKITNGINNTLDAVINPINEATVILDKISNGDLLNTVDGNYVGDHAKIKNAVNGALANLNDSLSRVSHGSTKVAASASQIGAGSQTVAQGASEQASSLEEVSANLQELSAITKRNASQAAEAKDITAATHNTAQKGKNSMDRLSLAMDKIKDSSDQISKIIKTIDEIAFQTNLLALNAAVEAARAGESGKGFAVVAEEVRALALRSAEAAKDTAAMIAGAVNNAEEGVELNQEVLQNLGEINDQINKVSVVMTEIASSSSQQDVGIDQINVAVSQMGQVTQQNAANSEQSAAAAQELASQAKEMSSMVAAFKLKVSTSEHDSAMETMSTEQISNAIPIQNEEPISLSPSKLIPFDDTPNGNGNGHSNGNGSSHNPSTDNDILNNF